MLNKMLPFIKKYKVHIIWAVAVILAFSVGFLVGKMGSSAPRQFAGGLNGENFGASSRGASSNRTGGSFAAGKIASINGQTITLQLPNGSSEVVFFSSSTSIIKPATASASSLTEGLRVMVGGSSNSDGSLTAQTIQIQTGSSTSEMGGGAAPGSESAGGSQGLRR